MDVVTGVVFGVTYMLARSQFSRAHPADYRRRVALAVCLLFDRRSERAVRALWDRIERVGVPSLRSHTHGRHVPHVSYAVLRSWDLPEVSAALLGVGGLAPVELSFDGVGLFRRGRAWLLAGGSVELHARQERVVPVPSCTSPLPSRPMATALFGGSACAIDEVAGVGRDRL